MLKIPDVTNLRSSPIAKCTELWWMPTRRCSNWRCWQWEVFESPGQSCMGWLWAQEAWNIPHPCFRLACYVGDLAFRIIKFAQHGMTHTIQLAQPGDATSSATWGWTDHLVSLATACSESMRPGKGRQAIAAKWLWCSDWTSGTKNGAQWHIQSRSILHY